MPKRFTLAALAALATGCANETARPAAAPDHQAAVAAAEGGYAARPESSPPPATPDYAAMIREQELAEAAKAEAVIDGMRAQSEATLRQRQEAREKARGRLRELCAETRPNRATRTQTVVKALLDYEKKLASRAAEIKSRCKLTTTPTGVVTFRAGSGGLRAEAEQQEGVSCRGGPPKGITNFDAWYFLSSHQDGAVDASGMAVIHRVGDEASEIREANEGCREGDLAAGLDTEARGNDAEGLRRFLEWKPPTPSE